MDDKEFKLVISILDMYDDQNGYDENIIKLYFDNQTELNIAYQILTKGICSEYQMNVYHRNHTKLNGKEWTLMNDYDFVSVIKD